MNNLHDTAIPNELSGRWFSLPHPEWLALPWHKKLWRQLKQRYWRWRNRNVKWRHVMPGWDGPRRTYVNVPPVWWVRDGDGPFERIGEGDD